MSFGAAFSTGAPAPAMIPTRCSLHRVRLPLALPALKSLRGHDTRCNIAATAERPTSDATDRQAPSQNGQLERGLDRDYSNGNGADVERLRSTAVYNAVSQALADGPNVDALRPSTSFRSADELSSLREDMGSMRELLSTQAELVRQQSHAIRQLKGMVSVQTQQVVKSVRAKQEVRPLDAQLAAIGDRRYLGMYDARFHSTNKCAYCLLSRWCQLLFQHKPIRSSIQEAGSENCIRAKG